MTTLITGGAGFIGSRLALTLIARGEPVVVFDNFNPYYDPAIKRENVAALEDRAVVVEGDVRDTAAIDALFQAHGIRRVAHLAAMANVRFSMDQGALYSDVNVTGSVNLFDAARRHGVEVFVLGSTSSVYGNTQRIPFVEDDSATLPLAPYPASKRAAEIFAHTYTNMYGLHVNVLRFFNVYGPHGRPDMMPLKALRAIYDGTPIPIFSGGALQRDWTYIDDIVEGVAAALQRPMGYQIMNLGFGAPVTLNQFIHLYETLIGKAAVLQDVPTPPSEPIITYCNNDRARELLGFAPRTAIAEGLAQTWAWYQERYLRR
ncbi:MAG: SDR family NAD(P)-dependent oxidoreductase [bacterium]|nr:SDR family NAD(P)-dependent oxidoreductase [bacterium]